MKERWGFAFLAMFSACSGKTEHDAVGAGGQGGGRAGTTGKSGTAGTLTGGGSNAGEGGASGMSGTSGTGGASGASGHQGGRAGDAQVAGASGTAPSEAGSANEAGAPGTAGESGGAGEAGAPNEPRGLSWPIECIPNQTCLDIGYPDTDADGDAHDCEAPGYVGHQGTDIRITPQAQAAGMTVRAAAAGVVVFAFDGKYDQCPNPSEPDCQVPPSAEPGSTTGTTVCSPVGPYCGTGEPGCYWCFEGGNVIVIRHEGVPGVFATRYDHLRRNSVLVEPGDSVTRGQKIAEAASAGNSTGPHLHFEVWGTGFYELADPWAGACGPNTGPSLWAYDPPWSD